MQKYNTIVGSENFHSKEKWTKRREGNIVSKLRERRAKE